MNDENEYNQKAYSAKKEWHKAQANLPLKQKFRILLELQKQDLPLIRKLRPLKYYEYPWPVEP